MADVGARDRLVMAGLVALGLLTVIAGVLSGHSTINYVLTRDAREAALSWAGEIDKGLSEQGSTARLLDKDVQVLDAAKFRADVADQAGKPASLPASSISANGFNLIENFDRLTGGRVLGRIKQTKDEFVSKLDGFAVLSPDQTPLAVAGNLSPVGLKDMLGHGDAAAALARSVAANAVETAELQGDGIDGRGHREAQHDQETGGQRGDRERDIGKRGGGRLVDGAGFQCQQPCEPASRIIEGSDRLLLPRRSLILTGKIEVTPGHV